MAHVESDPVSTRPFSRSCRSSTPVPTSTSCGRNPNNGGGPHCASCARFSGRGCRPPSSRPRPTGSTGRQRTYPLPLTFWAFLSQVLSPGSSCREIVRKVQAWYAPQAKTPDSGTSAYCQARRRLPLACLMALTKRWPTNSPRGSRPRTLVGALRQGGGRHGVSMPDTAANQQAWPATADKNSAAVFPVVKLVACFLPGQRAVLHWVEGTLRNMIAACSRSSLSVFKKRRDLVLARPGVWFVCEPGHALGARGGTR